MAATRNHVSLLEYKNLRFLITDRPTDQSLDKYLAVWRRPCATAPESPQILKEHHVAALVRVCEPTYSTDTITAANIKVLVGEPSV